MLKSWLLLENGEVFEGESFGVHGTAIGELVFTTGMTGCAESLTDPSYAGQLICFTFPQLGNYGIARADMESDRVHTRAVVVREFCREPSNFRSELPVEQLLIENGVCGICNVDTRRITQLIRSRGVMNAAVCAEKPTEAMLKRLREYSVRGVVAEVSRKGIVTLPAQGEAKYRVALIDYGAKRSIADNLVRRGCDVTLYPHDVSAEAILSGGYDGVMLSNGPGDPAENVYEIAQIAKLLGKLPVFGICLGHQMMALAAGARTAKMKFGHRGANQPARDLVTGRVYITSQNHGYAVDGGTLGGTGAVLRLINVNDGSCEGLDYPELRAFSLQFHPEAHGGPLDCAWQFDRFTAMMGGNALAEG